MERERAGRDERERDTREREECKQEQEAKEAQKARGLRGNVPAIHKFLNCISLAVIPGQAGGRGKAEVNRTRVIHPTARTLFRASVSREDSALGDTLRSYRGHKTAAPFPL